MSIYAGSRNCGCNYDSYADEWTEVCERHRITRDPRYAEDFYGEAARQSTPREWNWLHGGAQCP